MHKPTRKYALRLRTQGNAKNKVRKALKNGSLIKPKFCELCGRSESISHKGKSNIVAHHWNGYENALDVWFICHPCNMKLRGEEFHEGKITKDQARLLVN